MMLATASGVTDSNTQRKVSVRGTGPSIGSLSFKLQHIGQLIFKGYVTQQLNILHITEVDATHILVLFITFQSYE